MAYIYDLTDTWNNGATTFDGIKLDVTDTASAAASKLLDLQVGSAPKFRVLKTGATEIYNTFTDASNYERGNLGWSGNVLQLTASNAGTGSARDILLQPGTSKHVYFNSTSARSRLLIGSDGFDPTIDAGGGFWLNFRVGGTNKFCINPDVAIWGGQSIWNGPAITNNYLHVPGFSANPKIVGSGRQNAGSGTAAYDDTTHREFLIQAVDTPASASTNVEGYDIRVRGGNGASSSAGNAHGGSLYLQGGTGYGTGHHGYIIVQNMPTSDPGVTGALWIDGTTIKVS